MSSAIAARRPVRNVMGWLMLPALLALLACFAYPLSSVLVDSFARFDATQLHGTGFTLENYANLVTVPLYETVLIRTARIGLVVTVLCLVMAFPVALKMAFGPAWLRRTLLVLVICPILISATVRTFGWVLLLGLDGPVNTALTSLGILERPVKLTFNEIGVIIGLTHVHLPFMILPLASVLGKLDPRLIEAAQVLGAGNATVFRRVILPSSLPGIAAGATIVFTLSVGALVTPALLGGASFNLLAPLIAQRMLVEVNWPMGSALAILLIVMTMVALALSRLLTARRADAAR